MNRLELHRKAHAIREFALSEPISDTYQNLPYPALFPITFLGTNLEYIWRLILEGQDIITRGDSLVKTFRFSERDVLQAEKGIQSLYSVVNAPNHVCQKGWNKICLLPTHLASILTYHLDKANACNTEETRAAKQRDRVHQDFMNACRNGDYRALAELYSYSIGLLELESDRNLPQFLGKCFKNATSLDPVAVRAFFGREPNTGLEDFYLFGLKSDQRRNFTVWKDGQNLVETLLFTVGKSRPKTNFVQDLIQRCLS